MRLKIFFILLWMMTSPSMGLYGQLLTWSPAFPRSNDSIQITMDATRGNKGLINFNGDIYVHIGLITSSSNNSTDWKYAPFAWGGVVPASKAVALGNNLWSYSISNIRAFFNVPANETILRIAILFRKGNCTDCAAQRNADGSDMFVPVYMENAFALRFEKPLFQPYYNPIPEPLQLTTGQSLNVQARVSMPANLSLKLNNQELLNLTDTTVISNTLPLPVSGNYTITATATNSMGISNRDSFSFIVGGMVETKPLPPGTKPGINREPGDTSLVLALVAPNKTRISVIGDFPGSDWTEKVQYQMSLTPDRKTWWIRITGLQPNIEYSYQYLVDGVVKTADPYAEKVLDPSNDGFISSSTYPQLKAYPTGKTNGIVGVVQTNISNYVWKNKFTRPDKTKLVIYEMLLRDFLGRHDFNALTDTLNYLSSLGINAIELMPVQEFDGNLSWGYNPSFFFAVDKYYGTENSLKRLIDSCHGRGIAVIMDIVLNHATGSCPLAALYWDGSTQRPAADNPWFNAVARHPFNVFNDFNHESPDTKYFSLRVMEYWLKEYQIDGYRFDLSKGFTQKNNPSNVEAWSAYDASRIAIWKQYHDSIQFYSPGAYTILEHFADNAEEKELSGAGMLLWGNSNFNYNEASMGYLANSNFEWSLPQARGWAQPHLISYMESHDEERLVYKNLQFGRSSGSYSTKTLSTALERMKLATSFFLLSPGPKMIWQFGELGYDYSINTCVNGTINNNCRLDSKPITWQYLQDSSRKSLFDWYKKLLTLRKTNAFQSTGNVANYSLNGPLKTMRLSGSDLQVVIIGNFDVLPMTGNVEFPKSGTWIEVRDNSVLNITQNTSILTLQPGEYHVYIDKPFEQITSSKDRSIPAEFDAVLFPNPAQASSSIQFTLKQESPVHITLVNLRGQAVTTLLNKRLNQGVHHIQTPASLPAGSYIIRIKTANTSGTLKLIKY